MSTELKNVNLHYWPICGRGEPIRLFLEDAGVAYTESNETESWPQLKQQLDDYPFQQLPRLEVNGLKLAQQDAILRYLAAKAGYGGKGVPEQDVVVDMLGCAVEDLMTCYTRAIYSPEATKLLPELVSAGGQAPKSLAQYEHLLRKNQSSAGYFVYDHPSFAEFHLFYTIYALSRLSPSLLGNYSSLQAWYTRMSERKGIKAYLASGRRKELLNGSPSGQEPVVEA